MFVMVDVSDLLLVSSSTFGTTGSALRLLHALARSILTAMPKNKAKTRKRGEEEKRKIRSQCEEATVEAIKKKMRRLDEPEKAFICEDDQMAICTEQVVKDIFILETWTHEQLHAIHTKCYKTLLLLIYVGAGSAKRLGDAFFPSNSAPHQDPKLKDTCLPIKEKDTIKFLPYPCLDYFLREQYCFIPTKVREESHQNTLVVPKEFRLPWGKQSGFIGMGGYGSVKQISIPSGYLEQDSGAIWPGEKVVACKRIEGDHAIKDFVKEVKNLSILKESLTSHNHIIQHMGTVVHDTRYYILLPLALGDLELLLSECRDPESYDADKLKDNLDDRFHAMVTSGETADHLNQSYLLTDAVRWLHWELRVDQEKDLYCIHMDLKPGNVLIFDDPSNLSTVGKWKLSDFGISVIKDNTESQSANVLSVGDAYAYLDSGTRPQRNPGTYQAPEVQQRGPNNVGRGSDVWSLACIFSEVLAFALGSRKLLCDFKNSRMCEGDDYFYSPDYSTPLAPNNNNQTFRTRPQVIKWLERLPSRYRELGDWVECCVQIVLESLVVDTSKRPSVRQLRDNLQHAFQHFKDQDSYRGDRCGMIHNRPISSDAFKSGTDTNAKPFPDFDPPNELTDAPTQFKIPSSRVPQIVVPREPARHFRKMGFPLRRRSDSQDEDLNLTDTNVTTSDPSTKSSGSSSGRKNTVDLGPSQTVTLKPGLSQSTSRYSKHVKEAALSSQGDRAAWLVDSEIHVFHIDFDGTLEPKPSCMLDSSATWKNLSVSGSFVVVMDSSTKRVYLYDTNHPERKLSSMDEHSIATLKDVKVSQNGDVLLVSHNRLLLLGTESKLETRLVTKRTFPVVQDHTFHCASFSPSGHSILSWSYGRGSDMFYQWQVGGNGDDWVPSTRQYHSAHHGPPGVFMLPYDAGCFMRTPSKEFFSVGITDGHLGHSPVQKQKTLIPNVILAALLEDTILFTVVLHGLFHKRTRLEWRKISCDKIGRNVESITHNICQLQSDVEDSSKMQIVSRGDELVVIIFNKNGTIERVQLPRPDLD